MQTSAEEITPTTPTLHVLSYVTKIDSPTRATRVASWIALATGLLSVAFSLSAIAWFIYRTCHTAIAIKAEWGPGMGLAGLPWYSTFFLKIAAERVLFRDVGPLLLLVAVLLLPLLLFGIPLLFLVRGVGRGRGLSAILTGTWFGMATLCALAMTTAIPLVSLFKIVYLDRGTLSSAPVLGLATLPFGILLTLLCKDFCSLLFWIARHRGLDKPKVSFLPGRPLAA